MQPSHFYHCDSGAVSSHPMPVPPGSRRYFRRRVVQEAATKLSRLSVKQSWIWWRLPAPSRRNAALADLLEPDEAASWLSPEQTERLIGLMAPLHRARLADAVADGGRRVGALFRRMRIEHGRRLQRAEARFDGLAGCLRTPRGGSSRQAIVVVEDGRVRTRLLTPREAARLMGLADSYRLPGAATSALHVAGDGVAVPVVRWLAQEILQPVLAGATAEAPPFRAARGSR